MTSGWRARSPQITITLVTSALIVWIWAGWQTGLTALLASLVISALLPTPTPPVRKHWTGDRTYEVHDAD